MSVTPAHPGMALSEREQQMLQRVATGSTNEAIAAELYVAASTVKTTVDRARVKLGAVNRTHAVYLGLKAGVIQ